MALFRILEMDFRHLPNDICRLKEYFQIFWHEYQSGGVTCEVVSKMMKEFTGNSAVGLELGKEIVSNVLL
jgi:hypothetical protein